MAKKAPLPRPRFFRTREQLRRWFEQHHDRRSEVWIGYYKRGIDRAGVSYPEAVEEALCFGWIDGQVRSLDGQRYTNRFSPRRLGSHWSRANLLAARRLLSSGRMHESGRRAFAARRSLRPRLNSYGGAPVRLRPVDARRFRSSVRAWGFFASQPTSYRRTATSWVVSARRPATRLRRLESLIRRSGRGERIDLLSPFRPALRHGGGSRARG